MKPDTKRKCLFGISAVLLIFGIVLISTHSELFDTLLTLTPNSLVYQYWKKVPFHMSTNFYVFNWTNSEDLHNKSVKPRVEELGPYKYWQWEEKCNITWNQNGTVTFRQQRYWNYDHNVKNGNLDDVITTGNLVALVTSYISRNWIHLVRKGVFTTLSHTGLLKATITDSVKNVLWGYNEPLLKIASSLPFYPDLPKWDQCGWMYNRNGSSDFDGVFNMGTGVNSTLGQVYSWNYRTRTPYFDGSCGDVHGSAGQLYHRNMPKTWTAFFSADLRITVPLKFIEEEYVGNILGYKYVAVSILDNGTIYPENRCLCNGKCVPSGVVNVSATQFNLPMFVSLPHFHTADPYYQRSIDGLKPDPDKHKFCIIVEPVTGIPLKIDIAVQFSLLMQEVQGTKLFENMETFFLPVFWIHQRYEIYGYHAVLVGALANLSAIAISIGCLLIIVSLTIVGITIYKKSNQNRRQEQQIFREQQIPLKPTEDKF